MLRSPCLMKNVLALVAILSLATACAPQKHEESRAESGRTYTVRGQVTQLPDPAHPGSGTSSRAGRSHNQPSPLRQLRRRPRRTIPSRRAGAPTSRRCRGSDLAMSSGGTFSPCPTDRSRSGAPSTGGSSRRFPPGANGRAHAVWADPTLARILEGQPLARKLSERREQVALLLERAAGPVLQNSTRGDALLQNARRYTGRSWRSGARSTSASACRRTSAWRRSFSNRA